MSVAAKEDVYIEYVASLHRGEKVKRRGVIEVVKVLYWGVRGGNP